MYPIMCNKQLIEHPQITPKNINQPLATHSSMSESLRQKALGKEGYHNYKLDVNKHGHTKNVNKII